MKIHIPTPLRSYTGGLETVSISGATVNIVFEQLTVMYPELKQHLFTPEGKLRSFVNVYLNDLKDYNAMNSVYAQANWGDTPPVRTTVAPAGGIPGDSLVEIDLIARRPS